MKTHVELAFKGMKASAAVRQDVEKHLANLEKLYGRIISCHVTLQAPGKHHESGDAHKVNIHLALPDGRQVDISHTPQADKRHADLNFAVNDAFKRAGRRLQDEVRRMDGRIKHHGS
jgi:ribosome-associated translation inhibitor RaiA